MIPEPRSGPVQPDGSGYFSQYKTSGESRAVSARGRGTEHPTELRFITYLSPGIPREFFETVIAHVRRALGRRASLLVEPRVSGPMRGIENPFSTGEADVGFMCTPSFFWLRELEEPPVELLPAAPVFQDSSTPGQPVYFSEMIVRRESPVGSFLDVRGCSWTYNDPCSSSGYYNVLNVGKDGRGREVLRSGVLLRIPLELDVDGRPWRGGCGNNRL